MRGHARHFKVGRDFWPLSSKGSYIRLDDAPDFNFFFYLSVSLVFETGSHVAQVRLEFAVAGLELLNLLNLCFE